MSSDDLALVAKQIATEAHAGQRDKTGEPCIGHPAGAAADPLELKLTYADLAGERWSAVSSGP